MPNFSPELCRKIFKQIKNGYSSIVVPENLFFLKHIGFEDQANFDTVQEDFLELAKKRGVPTEEDVAARLKEEGLWSDEDEKKIVNELSFKENLIAQKRGMYLKSKIDEINVEIKAADTNIAKYRNKKAELFGSTAESFANEKVNDYYILKCLYKDRALESPVFSEEEFDDIDAVLLAHITEEYQKVYSLLTDENIQKLVLDDFFYLYLPFTESPFDFYGKGACELSYHQLKLLIYSRFFKNVLQNNDKMPEEIKKDPEKIMEYMHATENAKKIFQNKAESGGAQSLVGATKADYEYLNMKRPGQRGLSLKEAAKKSGGSLDMKQMMELIN